MKYPIVFLLITSTFFSLFAQSEAKLYADGNETDRLVPNTEQYELVFPITSEDAAKAFSSPMNIMNAVNYTLYIGGGDASLRLDNIYSRNEKKEGYKNWKKVAKAGDMVKNTIDGDEINDVLRILKENDWPDKDLKFKIWITTYANLNGDEVTLSEKWITIPKELKSDYLAKDNNEIYDFFKSGDASNNIDNPALADAIEKYMENKWPSENITTVNLRYFSYKDASKTTFKFEGYYISQKDGVCKYNSCYGNGVNASSRYSISFFNSMNTEKMVSCEIANQLKNR